MIIFPEKSSHYYTKDGKPIHSVPKKDGNGSRPTNIKDCRELGLLPSVTSCLSMKSKPGLEIWKISQGILSAITLPRIPEETDDAFVKRVVEDMGKESQAATEFGSSVHQAAELIHLNGPTVALDASVEPFIAGYRDWFKENVKEVIWAEKVLTNLYVGYAGCADLLYRNKEGIVVLADIKTQNVKDKVRVYPEWEVQLAAYSKCGTGYIMNPVFPTQLQSIVIDSGKPALPHIHDWPQEGAARAFEAFRACHTLWQFEKGYYFS